MNLIPKPVFRSHCFLSTWTRVFCGSKKRNGFMNKGFEDTTTFRRLTWRPLWNKQYATGRGDSTKNDAPTTQPKNKECHLSGLGDPHYEKTEIYRNFILINFYIFIVLLSKNWIWKIGKNKGYRLIQLFYKIFKTKDDLINLSSWKLSCKTGGNGSSIPVTWTGWCWTSLIQSIMWNYIFQLAETLNTAAL